MLISIPRASRAHRSQLDALRFPLAATESMFKQALSSQRSSAKGLSNKPLSEHVVGTRSEGARKLIFRTRTDACSHHFPRNSASHNQPQSQPR